MNNFNDNMVINFKKVSDLVEENLDKFKRIQRNISSRFWNLGQLLYKLTDDLNDREVSYFYKLLNEKLGFSISYMKKSKRVYSVLKKCGVRNVDKEGRILVYFNKKLRSLDIPFEWLKKVALVGGDNKFKIIEQMFNNSETMKQMTFKDFKIWLKEQFNIKRNAGFVVGCSICGEDLDWDKKDETWGTCFVHFTCFDELRKSKEELEDKVLYLDNVIEKLLKFNEKLRSKWIESQKKIKELEERIRFLNGEMSYSEFVKRGYAKPISLIDKVLSEYE